ncbi:MAG: DoxX family protein [Bacteroidales bacterium]|nr:DoxX family protein [Bacteroidales bacterium]
MKTIRTITRIILGSVFLFSGFVKGQDPLGTMFRVEDYLIAYHLDFLLPIALVIAILLCTLEFTIGFALFFNLRIRFTAWFTAGIMLFFTAITFYDALYSPVPDCGCFGDAIKLTNWQTFWKNIALLIFVVLLIISLPIVKKKEKNILHWGLIIAGATGFFLFSVMCYRNLPPVDFMAWKKGNSIYPENTVAPIFYVTYKNNMSGESQEFPANNYPFNDSIWMSEWSFINIRVDNQGNDKKPDILIFDSLGADYTDQILKNHGFQFILTSYDLETAGKADYQKINELASALEAEGHSFVMITASSGKILNDFIKENSIVFEVYQADDVPIKTMVRSNPGLILLHNNSIIDKWGWRNIPTIDNLIYKIQKIQ